MKTNLWDNIAVCLCTLPLQSAATVEPEQTTIARQRLGNDVSTAKLLQLCFVCCPYHSKHSISTERKVFNYLFPELLIQDYRYVNRCLRKLQHVYLVYIHRGRNMGMIIRGSIYFNIHIERCLCIDSNMGMYIDGSVLCNINIYREASM
jgi:hypothetical protein